MTQILLRRGTAEVAATSNPILAEGEPGWEKDTKVLKIGDGVTSWADLAPVGAKGGETFTFTFAGAVSAPYSGTLRFYIDEELIVTRIRASVGVAPAGQDLVIDVNRNGATLFADQSERPTISAGDHTGVIDPVGLVLYPGNYLSIDVDQAGTDSPGAELVVQVRTVPA